MSPAAPGKAPAKKASAKAAAAGPTDAELRDALIGLTSWDAMPWPHVTSLGQLMMWASAYTRGVLPSDGPADPAPYGLIAD